MNHAQCVCVAHGNPLRDPLYYALKEHLRLGWDALYYAFKKHLRWGFKTQDCATRHVRGSGHYSRAVECLHQDCLVSVAKLIRRAGMGFVRLDTVANGIPVEHLLGRKTHWT